jgi:hypothetical protein
MTAGCPTLFGTQNDPLRQQSLKTKGRPFGTMRMPYVCFRKNKSSYKALVHSLDTVAQWGEQIKTILQYILAYLLFICWGSVLLETM